MAKDHDNICMSIIIQPSSDMGKIVPGGGRFGKEGAGKTAM